MFDSGFKNMIFRMLTLVLVGAGAFLAVLGIGGGVACRFFESFCISEVSTDTALVGIVFLLLAGITQPQPAEADQNEVFALRLGLGLISTAILVVVFLPLSLGANLLSVALAMVAGSILSVSFKRER